MEPDPNQISAFAFYNKDSENKAPANPKTKPKARKAPKKGEPNKKPPLRVVTSTKSAPEPKPLEKPIRKRATKPQLAVSMESILHATPPHTKMRKLQQLVGKDAAGGTKIKQSLRSYGEPKKPVEKPAQKSILKQSIVVLNAINTPLTSKPLSERKQLKKTEPNSLDELQDKKGGKKAKKTPVKNLFKVVMVQDNVEDWRNLDVSGANSVENGKNMLSYLVYPVTYDTFLNSYWEKQPLFIKRDLASYFCHMISSEDIDRALRKQRLFYAKNVDVTTYINGKRETHNLAGRATAPQVWDYYSNECSIRLLDPQNFFPKIHKLNALLQELFQGFVGANVYLTPPDSQGFAPHYDDIEAFVLQCEGQKVWKLYAPRTAAETLPRFSSDNFTDADFGEPLHEVILNPGDILYFPRGTIHQGRTLAHSHSLHITLSMYQKNSWGDFIEKLLPVALKRAMEDDISYREGLPIQYLSHMGLVNSDKTTVERMQFFAKLQNLMGNLFKHAPVDAACDQMGKEFILSSLPPVLSKEDTDCMAWGDGARIKNGVVTNRTEIDLDTKLKLVRYNCIRVVREDDDALRIYYNVDNSREYREVSEQFLEIDDDCAPIIDAFIHNYPNYTAVADLPTEDEGKKLQLASDLWDQGLLMAEAPLPIID